MKDKYTKYWDFFLSLRRHKAYAHNKAHSIKGATNLRKNILMENLHIHRHILSHLVSICLYFFNNLGDFLYIIQQKLAKNSIFLNAFRILSFTFAHFVKVTLIFFKS